MKDGKTAAMVAVRTGKEGCLKFLIAAGANLDLQDNVCEFFRYLLTHPLTHPHAQAHTRTCTMAK